MSTSGRVILQPVDVADVTILVDNTIDILLPGTETAQRAPMAWDWSEREQLIAEHGYALLLTVERDGRRESVLYDAGLGRNTVLHNMDVLEVRPNELRAVILSHGHADHHGGLEGIFKRIGRRNMPRGLHPDVGATVASSFPPTTKCICPRRTTTTSITRALTSLRSAARRCCSMAWF